MSGVFHFLAKKADVVIKMEQKCSSDSPIVRWLAANQDSPSFQGALRRLLSFACAEWFLKGSGTVVSPEKALSWVISANLPRLSLGQWMEDPQDNLEEIACFCESVKTNPLPKELKCEFPKVLDLRGVKCPRNSARSRLVMSGLPEGFRMTIYLDDGSPIENVPGSLVADGNIVEKREKKEGFWALTVVKHAASV